MGPGNVISGNTTHGVELLHKSTQGNVIFSNDIGVGSDGKTPLPNGQGILISNGAYFNAIGGSFGGNVISCNTSGAGIEVGAPTLPGDGETSTAGYLVYIQGNLIGTDSTGLATPNSAQYTGIYIDGSSTQVVITGNVIAGQGGTAVTVYNSSYDYINGNWIGQSSTGVPLNNSGYGVYFNNVSFSYQTQNAFGSNTAGSFGSTGGSGNVEN